MTNTRWFKTDYVEEKCEEFVLLSEHKPEKAVRKIWPLLVWFLPVCSLERSFTEAKTFFERALKLLKRQAPGLERTERQAVLLTGLGGVIMATQGWGASESEEAYSQAWALRQNLGENPKLFSALYGEPGISEQRWINHRALPGDCLHCRLHTRFETRRGGNHIACCWGRLGIPEIARPNPQTVRDDISMGIKRRLPTINAVGVYDQHQLALLSDGLDL